MPPAKSVELKEKLEKITKASKIMQRPTCNKLNALRVVFSRRPAEYVGNLRPVSESRDENYSSKWMPLPEMLFIQDGSSVHRIASSGECVNRVHFVAKGAIL